MLEEDVVVVVIVVVVVVVVVVKYLNIDEADVDRDQVTSRFSPLRFSSLYCSVTRTPSPGHTVFSTTRYIKLKGRRGVIGWIDTIVFL